MKSEIQSKKQEPIFPGLYKEIKTGAVVWFLNEKAGICVDDTGNYFVGGTIFCDYCDRKFDHFHGSVLLKNR